jgi:ribonuclease VapC
VARIVVDASAVIALLRNEVGSDRIETYMGDALISSVNLQEVIKALLQRGITIGTARKIVDGLHLEVRAHAAEHAYAAAALDQHTRTFGSGLGDRTCMALAIAEGLPVLTTDKAWAKIAIPGLSVVLAR